MWKYDLLLEKYWVTHSSHFIIGTEVVLVLGIKDTKILFCRGISDNNRYKVHYPKRVK